ncbi:MAG: class I SAM-dependent methyltransferase [Patescibacteria group bacterium]
MFHPKGPTLWELVKQALSSTKVGYDLLAPKFDYTPFATPEWIINATMKQLLKENGGKKFMSAKDFCTGTGAAIGGLLKITNGVVIGIDWSEPMLEKAREKFFPFLDYELSSVRLYLVCGDIFQGPMHANAELVTCFGALGHIEKHQQKAFMKQAHDALRANGIFAFVTAERPKWYQPRSWPYFIFDAIMKVRNWAIKPEFVMYYINFLLPDILELFDKEKWSEVKVVPLEVNGRKTELRLVMARKK